MHKHILRKDCKYIMQMKVRLSPTKLKGHALVQESITMISRCWNYETKLAKKWNIIIITDPPPPRGRLLNDRCALSVCFDSQCMKEIKKIRKKDNDDGWIVNINSNGFHDTTSSGLWTKVLLLFAHGILFHDVTKSQKIKIQFSQG